MLAQSSTCMTICKLTICSWPWRFKNPWWTKCILTCTTKVDPISICLACSIFICLKITHVHQKRCRWEFSNVVFWIKIVINWNSCRVKIRGKARVEDFDSDVLRIVTVSESHDTFSSIGWSICLESQRIGYIYFIESTIQSHYVIWIGGETDSSFVNTVTRIVGNWFRDLKLRASNCVIIYVSRINWV